MKSISFTKLVYIVFHFLLFSTLIASNQLDSIPELPVSHLPTGEQVFESGKVLVAQPNGFTHIVNPNAIDSTTILIAVHGYATRGYEWIVPVTNLAVEHSLTYFWRYDWEECPDNSGWELAQAVSRLVRDYPLVERVVIMGHSLGGLVVTYCAAYLDLPIPAEIHTIAAPLAGIPRLLDKCKLDNNRDGIPDYLKWDKDVSHIQWRTVHSQDNAFNKYDVDPQKMDLPGSAVILLPSTMDGRRLGHNWSVTWVIREYLGLPNSP
ncbi:MAG: esterase/lipase family protein [Fidelibacterota bacterium]